jgi:hypothetical protein
VETTFRETERAEIVCEHQIPLQSRLIVAAMLGFVLLFFLYHLVSGLVEYVRHATPAEWLSGLPGFLVILALFLLSAAPVLIAVVGRTRVVADLQAGIIREVRDLRIHRRTTSVPISSVLGVSVSRQRRNFRIQVDLSDRKPITVGYEESAWEAREVAARLAGHLRTTVQPEGDVDA